MDDMHPGSVILTSAFNRQFFEEDGKEFARFGYKAPKGKAFVFVLLGATEKGKSFDAVAALKALGWQPDAETAKALAESEAVSQ